MHFLMVVENNDIDHKSFILLIILCIYFYIK